MISARRAAAGVLSAGLIVGSKVVAMRDWLVEEVLDPCAGEILRTIRNPLLEAGAPRFLISAPAWWSAMPTITQTSTAAPSRTAALVLTTTSSTICPLPPDWQVITLSASDSLERLAAQYQVSTAGLLLANCPGNPILTTGMAFYVPAKPPAEPLFTSTQVDPTPPGDSPTPTNTPHPG